MALSRDARLVARARRGDAAAFEALHARHQPAILSFCRHLTGNREDAEDAVQHTFLAAYRKIVESDERIDPRPWLFAVARNRCVSLLRARRESAAADPDAAATNLEGLAVEVERRQDLRDLVRDLARLPEAQRAALVLSQLDALSYREIGGVLGVEPEKVKALVFQARSSLASTREAREAPCAEIRQEIATARGAGLRRRLLRRHVGQCDGCREFEVAMQRQRHQLDVLLPAVPSVGLAQAVLGGALGREGAAAGVGTGGAVAAAGGSGGLSGLVAAVGLGGATKLAVVAAVVAGGGVSAAVAADLPERIGDAVPLIGDGHGPASGRAEALSGNQDTASGGRGAADPEVGRDDRAGTGGPARDDERPDGDVDGGRDPGADGADGERSGDDGDGTGASEGAEAAAPGAGGTSHDGDGSGPGGGLPPGLAKRGDDLPPGLAKRGEDLPPGLAKRVGEPHGQSGTQASPGRGNGGSPPGQSGAGQGNGNGGGQGNGNGNGNGGQGNGNGSDAATGNAGGQGNGNGNGNGGQGGGQGSGNPGQGAGNGNGNPGQANGNGGGKPK